MTDQTNRPPFETFKGETIRLRQLVVAREHEIERLQSALDAIQTERASVCGTCGATYGSPSPFCSAYKHPPAPEREATPDVCPDCGLAHRVHAWNCPRVTFATVSIVPCSIGGAPLRDETPRPKEAFDELVAWARDRADGYEDNAIIRRAVDESCAASPSDETPEAKPAIPSPTREDHNP